MIHDGAIAGSSRQSTNRGMSAVAPRPAMLCGQKFEHGDTVLTIDVYHNPTETSPRTGVIPRTPIDHRPRITTTANYSRGRPAIPQVDSPAGLLDLPAVGRRQLSKFARALIYDDECGRQRF